MKLSSSLLSIICVGILNPSRAQYSYQPGDPTGPESWATLSMDGNQCGGYAQSGIDIPTSNTCDGYDGYIFSVSTK